MTETTAIASETDAVIQEIGLIVERQGSPRIAGLVFGLLLVEGTPMSLQDMAVRLNIARASASTNARLLAARGLIRLTSRFGDRQDYYEIVPDPFCSLLDRVGREMLAAADSLSAAVARLPRQRDDARGRVEDLADAYRVSSEFVAEWSKTMDARRKTNS